MKDHLPQIATAPQWSNTLKLMAKWDLILSNLTLPSWTSEGALFKWCLSAVEFGIICATLIPLWSHTCTWEKIEVNYVGTGRTFPVPAIRNMAGEYISGGRGHFGFLVKFTNAYLSRHIIWNP